MGNGPQFIAYALAKWVQSKSIAPQHPTLQTDLERLCRTIKKTHCTEVLDCYVFEPLQEMRDMTADWLHRYNHHRPYEALGRIPPVEYRVELFPNLFCC